MNLERHPAPESALLRLGAPIASTALLAVVIVAMLSLPRGATQTAVLVVAVVLGFALILVRTVTYGRAGLPRAWLMQWHRFSFLWGATSGYFFLIADEPSTGDVVSLLGQQLVFALVLTALLWFMEGAQRRRDRRDRSSSAEGSTTPRTTSER